MTEKENNSGAAADNYKVGSRVGSAAKVWHELFYLK